MDSLAASLRRAGLDGQPVSPSQGPVWKVGGVLAWNFASAHYLGLQRFPGVRRLMAEAMGSAAQAWGVSLGMPRLLAEDSLTHRLEGALAQLSGQEAALVFPSTTHLALDVIPFLAGKRGVILADSQAYPITLQGAALAAHAGAQVRVFAHNDPQALQAALHKCRSFERIVIACDGVYPAGSQVAPLAEFSRLAEAHGAFLYVDDAHGFGVLGAHPAPACPLGRGGAGALHFSKVRSAPGVYAASLSKAFGVPLAFAAGERGMIAELRQNSSAIVHSSPVALPLVAAALAALRVHRSWGDALRLRLVSFVLLFRAELGRMGIVAAGGPFLPIQTLLYSSPRVALQIGRALRQKGIWPVLQLDPPEQPGGGALRFVWTAAHLPKQARITARLIATLHNKFKDPSEEPLRNWPVTW